MEWRAPNVACSCASLRFPDTCPRRHSLLERTTVSEVNDKSCQEESIPSPTPDWGRRSSLGPGLLLPQSTPASQTELVVRLTPTKQPDSKCLWAVTFPGSCLGMFQFVWPKWARCWHVISFRAKSYRSPNRTCWAVGFHSGRLWTQAAIVYFCPWKKVVGTPKSWRFGWGLISMMCFQNISWYESIPHPIIRF